MKEIPTAPHLSIWSTRPYYRLNVKDYIEEFVGWKNLTALITHSGDSRNQTFFSTLFLTGGRVSEVLQLQDSNFIVNETEGVIICRDMPLLKRYKKIGKISSPEEPGPKWKTEKLIMKRKPFPILLKEPLTQNLLRWFPDHPGLLFPSPYKPDMPLSRFWAYHQIRRIDKELPLDLRTALGVNKPFIYHGQQVADTLHLWLHWFRSQRASQLVSDYGFEIIDLINFFGWERHETALHYTRKGWRGLASKMQSTQVTYT